MIGSVELMCLIGSSALSCPEIFWKSMRQNFYKRLFSNFLTIPGIGDFWTLISKMTSVPPIFWDAIETLTPSKTFYLNHTQQHLLCWFRPLSRMAHSVGHYNAQPSFPLILTWKADNLDCCNQGSPIGGGSGTPLPPPPLGKVSKICKIG